MSISSSLNIIKVTKKESKKKHVKDIKAFLKKKKKKKLQYGCETTKFYQKIKNKRWLSIEKSIIK